MIINLIKSFAFAGGEWVIYVLLLCSIASIAVIIERYRVIKEERKVQKEVNDLFESKVQDGSIEKSHQDFSSHSGLLARVLSTGLSKISSGVETVEESMMSVAGHEKKRLEIRLIILNTLGNNAIYIGLFGTVLGVIKAFNDLAQQSGSGPEVVMAGLSEALVATAIGLFVAIPCVVAYNTFQKQIKDILSETDSATHVLLARLKSSKK